MEFFDGIKTFIFLVSSILLYPVLILLALSTVYLIWEAGRFLGEWMERARCAGIARSCGKWTGTMKRLLHI